MSRNAVPLGVFILLLFASLVQSQTTQINYTVTNIGANQWQYTYEGINISLFEPIREFTIWFDYGMYQNLLITTPNPPAGNWDEVVWQPELGLGNGGYDALTLGSGINTGQSVKGFSVSFDWLGMGKPSSQLYEIINPETFETIESGNTIPEPAMFLYILSGSAFLRIRRKLHRNI